MDRSRALSRRSAAVLLFAFLSLTTPPAAPVLGLSSGACRVKNLDTEVTKLSLQAAVTAARRGDHLTVRGRCHGITTISKSLTITGIRPEGAVVPTLDGDDRGSVVKVRAGVDVWIKALTIADGRGIYDGGGVGNHGTLTLDNVIVRGSTYCGITNEVGTLRLRNVIVRANDCGITNQAAQGVGAIVILRGRTSIDHNTGVGLQNTDGRVTLYDSSSIHDNVAQSCAGAWTRGPMTLNDSSSIHHNTALEHGGGACIGHPDYLVGGGSMMLNGSSSIHHNAAAGGGGVYLNRGSGLTLNDQSSIHDNTVTEHHNGGGVASEGDDDTITLNGSSSIYGNSATHGGGVYSFFASITLDGSSSIYGNTASGVGGGVYNDRDSSLALHMASSIHHNVAGNGGGIYNAGGSITGAACATDPDGNVHDNTPDDCLSP